MGTRDRGLGTWDPSSGTTDSGPQYDQVGPGIRDPPGETQDAGLQNF